MAADLDSYIAHAQKKRIWFGLPASAGLPIALMIPFPFMFGIWGPILLLVWVAFLKYTDSKGYSFIGYYRRKIRGYAGGYTARPRTFRNVDF